MDEKRDIPDNAMLIQISFQQEKLLKLNNEILWAHIFEDTICSSSWLTDKSFSPGRWAAGYPMLYILYRIFQNVKPRNILELGLGQSSKLSIQYKKAHQDIYLNIIENDRNWINFFSNEISDVLSNVTILPVVSVLGDNCLFTNHYDGLLDVIKGIKYNFIIIDGPKGTAWKSRPQIIDIVENNLLADSFVILMDDYDRKGEKQTINDLLGILREKKIPFVFGIYSGEKDVIVICSLDNKFVTSL